MKDFFPLFPFLIFAMEKSEGVHAPPVPHPLVLSTLLSVIFDYCFRN